LIGARILTLKAKPYSQRQNPYRLLFVDYPLLLQNNEVKPSCRKQGKRTCYMNQNKFLFSFAKVNEKIKEVACRLQKLKEKEQLASACPAWNRSNAPSMYTIRESGLGACEIKEKQ